MKIGNIQLTNRVISAPMAGVTDKSFRSIVNEMGCGLIYTEMISDMALLYENEKTLSMVDLNNEQGLLAVQIFGSNPITMAEAAKVFEAKGAKIIDINMGCPAPKIVKNGEGAALLNDLVLAEKIISAVVKAVNIPVTLKTRLGWDEQHIVVDKIAKIAQEQGVKAIAIHGRTREQFYSGHADWKAIARVKQSVSIPVIGNGDVWSPEDAQKMIDSTNCDGVMIGRGAMGNPWLYKQTIDFLATGTYDKEIHVQDKAKMALRHLNLLIEEKGEYVAVREMRKHASWYFKGIPGATKMRNEINIAETKDEMKNLILKFPQNIH